MTSAAQAGAEHILLICSVGGTPEPLVKTLLYWRPARVIFLPSEQTRSHVDVALRAYAETAGAPLSPGQYDVRVVSDAEDLHGCVRSLRSLDAEVRSWITRPGGDYRVIVDFTAGTKCMSAALALVARRWPCRYSYVGGQQRTKEGVGVVQTGAERVVHSANPWDAFGYQAVEDAVTVFNHGGYAAAAALLDNAMKHVGKPEVKRELATLKAVVDAYAAWDRFDHQQAAQRFADALRNRNDLTALFPHDGSSLIVRLERHLDRADELKKQKEPTIAWIEDLMHNARRRAAERRFDDAVARLYRAFEALAQIRLRNRHGIADTGRVPLDRLPEPLRRQWAARTQDRATTGTEPASSDAPPSGSPARSDDHPIMLGLQDAWRVLKELGDELGRKFFDLKLADQQGSPLVARNSSILAHGFQPVGEKVYNCLIENLIELLQCAVPAPAGVSEHCWRLPGPQPAEATTTAR